MKGLTPFLVACFFLMPLCVKSAQLFSSSQNKDQDPKLLYLGGGGFNILQNKKTANIQLEYRSDFPIYRSEKVFIRPLIGAMATARGSTYLYGGVAFDLFPTPFLAFTPSFAPGLYYKGGGKDLGFPLEYRSCVELSYRFENRSRLGGMFYHISNASMGSSNPGTECFIVFFGLPLCR